MKYNWKIFLTVLSCFILSGCTYDIVSTRERVETIVGPQTILSPEQSTIYGMSEADSLFAISVSPAEVTQLMDNHDRMYLNDALIKTPSGKKESWSNDKQGIEYVVRTFEETKHNSQICRRSLVSSKIDGVVKQAYMSVCRDGPDAQWIYSR